MGCRYVDDDFDWLYPSRPLHLLQHRQAITDNINALLPDNRFKPYWVHVPHEFVIALHDGEFAGIGQVERIANTTAKAHIMLDAGFLKTNLGTLLSKRLLKHGFETLGLGKIMCSVGHDKKHIQRLATGVGFKRAGCYTNRIDYKITWPQYRGTC